MTPRHTPDTPAGRTFASDLAQGEVLVGSVPGCDAPGCTCGRKGTVLISIEGHTVKTANRDTVDRVIETLREASLRAWGPRPE